MPRKQWIIIASVASALVIAVVVGVTVGVVVGRRKSSSQTVERRAHDLLADNPLIDGHNDWPWLLRVNFQNQIADLDLNNMTQYNLKNTTPTHTDITRLRQGQVGGQFWSIYTGCDHQGKDAAVSFMEQIDLMNRLIKNYPDVFQMATTAAEVRDAFSKKRIASLYGIEGGQAIESSFAILRLFYQLGVRYMTLTHNCNNPWADQNQVDSNVSPVQNDGLNDHGKDIVREMNRLGMLVDLSHVSKKTMLDALRTTKSPVIFSHSSAYALCNHTRNVQDDVLRLLKENKGVVMVAFVPSFITCNNSNPGTIADVAAHIEHIRSIAGAESIGLGADYDGISQTIPGLHDVSTYPRLIEHLLRSGNWTDAEIINLIGGNILRVLTDNENMARELQKSTKPFESLISVTQLEIHNQTQCRHMDMYPSTQNNTV